MIVLDETNATLRAMLALDAGRMGSWSWDIVAGHVVGDPFVAKLLSLDFASQPWPLEAVFANMHPDDLPAVQDAVDAALLGADNYEVTFRDGGIDPATGKAGARWLGARGRVTERDATGAPLRMIGVNWDATAQKNTEERLALLAGEMDHRVKNAFAVIRALINLGARTPGDKADFAASLRSQVEAMASAHELSARMARTPTQDQDTRLPVSELLKTALAPWLGAHEADRVSIEMFIDFSLEPFQVSALSMLLYELATNAVKYGSLGEAGGRLRVTGDIVGDDTAQLAWVETTHSDITPPADVNAAGFGSVLMSHCAKSLGATIDRTYHATGLTLTIEFPRTRPR